MRLQMQGRKGGGSGSVGAQHATPPRPQGEVCSETRSPMRRKAQQDARRGFRRGAACYAPSPTRARYSGNRRRDCSVFRRGAACYACAARRNKMPVGVSVGAQHATPPRPQGRGIQGIGVVIVVVSVGAQHATPPRPAGEVCSQFVRVEQKNVMQRKQQTC